MAAEEDEREALLAIADRLCEELGFDGDDTKISDRGALLEDGRQQGLRGVLNEEDELLVSRIRQGLARLAAGITAMKSPSGASVNAVGAALEGVEMVMRGELVMGNAARLPDLIPSFVFVVALPLVEQDAALELSRRSEELVEETLEGNRGAG